MEHVVYIHINSHDVLPNMGLSFDSHYDVLAEMQPIRDYEHHLTTFKLCIKSKDGVEDGFYGEHIQSLTAVVGNNGAGKTTALRFLLNAVVSGSGHDISGFVVTEKDGQLVLHHSEDVRVQRDDSGLNFRIENRHWPEIESFVYGGHVNILTSAEDMMSVEMQGMVNATEGHLLTADLQHYGRELSTNGLFKLREYASAFDSQNQWRICNFLAQYEGPLKQQLHLPGYVLVLPNKSGQWSLRHRMNETDRIDFPDLNIPQGWTFREFRLAEVVYYSFINYISDEVGQRDVWQTYMNDWSQMVVDHYEGNVLTLFRQFIDSRQLPQNDEYRICLEYIHEVIENVSVHCQFDERSLLRYFYFRAEDESMKTFLGWIQTNPVFIASRHFDMRYAHYYDSGSILSSGEKAMLDMYSRIYDTLITKHQHNSNYLWPTLFILDEAEIGFHPEWQRNYIKNLTLFMEEMAIEASNLMREFYHNQPDFKYQIILTSHSPIILSDVPQECVIMLQREGDVVRNVTVERQQTFGTNIFELYRDSFFLDSGLMGRFAEDYIRQLSDEISRLQHPDAATVENIRKRIDLIGDRNIKEYLLEQMEPYMGQQALIDDYQLRITYYQEQINRLQHGQD